MDFHFWVKASRKNKRQYINNVNFQILILEWYANINLLWTSKIKALILMWSELKKSNILPAELQKQAASFSQGEIDDVLVCCAAKVPMPSVLWHCSLQKEQLYRALQQIETGIVGGCFRRVAPFKIAVHVKKHFEALRHSSGNVYKYCLKVVKIQLRDTQIKASQFFCQFLVCLF